MVTTLLLCLPRSKINGLNVTTNQSFQKHPKPTRRLLIYCFMYKLNLSCTKQCLTSLHVGIILNHLNLESRLFYFTFYFTCFCRFIMLTAVLSDFYSVLGGLVRFCFYFSNVFVEFFLAYFLILCR